MIEKALDSASQEAFLLLSWVTLRMLPFSEPQFLVSKMRWVLCYCALLNGRGLCCTSERCQCYCILSIGNVPSDLPSEMTDGEALRGPECWNLRFVGASEEPACSVSDAGRHHPTGRALRGCRGGQDHARGRSGPEW